MKFLSILHELEIYSNLSSLKIHSSFIIDLKEITKNGFKITKIINYIKTINKDMCRIQEGRNLVLSRIQIEQTVRSEIAQMVYATQTCRQGMFSIIF